MTVRWILRLLLSLSIVTMAMATSCSSQAAALDAVPDAVLGKPDFATPAGGAASSTNLLRPGGLAEDPVSGELWVADTGANRVLRFASARAFANGEAANAVLGQADFSASAANRGGPAAAGTLARPTGLAVDAARRLYVADTGNHRVLVFGPPYADGMAARVVVGQDDFAGALANRGAPAPTSESLAAPQGLALDLVGNLWVADTGNARVLQFSGYIEGQNRSPDGVLGQPGFTTAAANLTARGLSAPVGLAIDGDSHLWVVDRGHHRVLKYPPTPLLTTNAAAVGVLCQGDFVTAVSATSATGCLAPAGVAIDGEGRVHVTDSGNHRVLRFDAPAPGAAADAILGQALPGDGACNRGAIAPTDLSLCGPSSLGVDRRGNLLVADGGNGRLLRYDIPVRRARPVARATSPAALARNSPGATLTVDGERFTDDAVVLWNGLPRPTRFVSAHRLLADLPAADVAAAGPHAVRVVTPAPGGGESADALVVDTYERAPFDAAADGVLGQPGFASGLTLNRSVGAGQVGFFNASSLHDLMHFVTIDPVTGRVFANDAWAGRVLSWPNIAAVRDALPADVVIGKPDAFASQCDFLAPTASELCDAAQVAIDEAGRLYVAESIRHRVLRFDPPFATGMAASRVFGQAGSFATGESNLGGLGPASLDSPSGLAVHGRRLFILDGGNMRILVYDDPDARLAADAVIGQADFASAGFAPASATRFRSPYSGLATDREGRLFLADSHANRVLRFSPPFANDMAADLVVGQANFTGTGAGLSASRFDFPWAVALDESGALLVADRNNHRVLRFPAPLSDAMAATGVLGQAGFGTGVPSATSRTSLLHPVGIAADKQGNVVVIDSGRSRILAYDRPFASAAAPGRLVNLSTRMSVRTGDDVLIGGFVIGGTQPKNVVLRARGPSLAGVGVPNALLDPELRLFSGQTVIAANDTWSAAPNAAAIELGGFAPNHSHEAAILARLAPGAYTAIVSGVGGTTGVGLVEVFEVDVPASPLANIATRGNVRTGSDVMIAGFIIQGETPQTVVIRARGPSLAPFGFAEVLADPVLQLFSGATPIATNDDWSLAADAPAILASGFAPAHVREAAILVTLNPGAYTAIVSGAGGTTGIGLVEVFAR